MPSLINATRGASGGATGGPSPFPAEAPLFLVVDHYKAGDRDNAIGLASALAGTCGGEIVMVRGHLRLAALTLLLNPWLRWRRRCPATPSLGRRLWPLLFTGDAPPAMRVAAVVSTLGRGEAVGAFIAALWRVPAVHLGTPKRMDRALFAAVVAHQGHIVRPDEIGLPIASTRLLRAGLPNASPGDGRRRILFLLGGDSDEIRYEDAYWRDLGELVARGAEDPALNITVLTAPRTAARVVEGLRRRLADMPVRLLVFGEPAAKDRYVQEIVDADTVITTAESVSMVSDAINTGKPVFVLLGTQVPWSPRIASFLLQQTKMRRIALVDLTPETPPRFAAQGIMPAQHCWSVDFLEEIRAAGLLS
ncbi:ELM1/GtrOC1 family putative glycosyltransferase [Zavarzinia sp.]|uniref:ELM1/GtrOC1 family putative glycosyltransferase n=1 Tax=Zavarzinia sp. TaxID=2027920 RepID=UPI003BB55615